MEISGAEEQNRTEQNRKVHSATIKQFPLTTDITASHISSYIRNNMRCTQYIKRTRHSVHRFPTRTHVRHCRLVLVFVIKFCDEGVY